MVAVAVAVVVAAVGGKITAGGRWREGAGVRWGDQRIGGGGRRVLWFYHRSTLYNIHCALYTVHYTLNTIHRSLSTVLCTLYSVRCKLYTVYSTVLYKKAPMYYSVFPTVVLTVT